MPVWSSRSFLRLPDAHDFERVSFPELPDPAGRAAAIYGVARKSIRWGFVVENAPTWFVIDRNGILRYKSHPSFESRDSYITDVDRMLDALREAAGETNLDE